MAAFALERKLLCTHGMRGRVIAALAGAVLFGATEARALGSLSDGTHRPIEQRVAIGVGPQRSALWTQLRVRSTGGPLAIVVPALPGAALDWSSPAWFEALESATAPRILPPDGASGVCPGETADSVVDVAGDLYHHDPLAPLEVIVLDDAAAVASWAEQHGMYVGGASWSAMSALAEHRFVAARFTAPNGETLTPALRITGPGAVAALPLVLTAAGSEDLLVTSFVIGPGRAALDGAPAALALDALSFDAAAAESNYRALRSDALGAGAWLVESSSREGLAGTLVRAELAIDGALRTYFTRGALYQGGSVDAAACIAEASAALGEPGAFSESCPRADLGVVAGTPGCSESPAGIDAGRLRCGTLMDDLAVALSGQIAASAWLSRIALLVPRGELGSWRSVTSAPASKVDPLLEATSVDVSGCEAGVGASPGGGGQSGTGAAPGAAQVPVYRVESSCGARHVGEPLYVENVEYDSGETAPDAYYQEEDCQGDTSDSYTPIYYEESGDEYDSGGDCSSDTSESYDDGGDCQSDTSESTYEDGDDCQSDTSESYDDGGDCQSDTGDSDDADCGSDTGSDDGDCSFAPRRRPRLSLLVFLATAVAIPLRRGQGGRLKRSKRAVS